MICGMKMKYTYWDNGQLQWVQPVPPKLHGSYQAPKIFECFATSISEADKKIEAALADGSVKIPLKNEKKDKKTPKSFDMNKMGSIGCTFEKLTWWQKVLSMLHLLH